MSVDISKYAVNYMKNNLFWKDLLDVFSQELDNFKLEKLENALKNYYFYNEKEDDILFNISDMFGDVIDTSLTNNLAFLRNAVESIGFKKNYKTSKIGLSYGYKSIDRLGEVFLAYYSDNYSSIQRVESQRNIDELADATITDFSKPLKFWGEDDVEGYFPQIIAYDEEVWYDEGTFYDLQRLKAPTTHVAVEYFIDRLVIVDGTEYTMTNNMLLYLRSASDYNRRAVQIQHIGGQISFFCDASGLYDNYFAPTPNDYTLPDIKTRSVLKEGFAEIYSIKKVKLGTGTQDLPSLANPALAFPTDLDNPIYTDTIDEINIIVDSPWYIVQSMIGIKTQYVQVSELPIATIDDTLTNFPIQKGGFNLTYTIGSTTYTVSDDGAGNIRDSFVDGTLDYETGVLSCSLSTPTEADTSTEYTYTYNSFLKDTHPDFELTNITEIGLFDDSEELVAYATFPPYQYNDNLFHLSFQFNLRVVDYSLLVLEGGDSSSEFETILDGGNSLDEFTDIKQGV